MLKMTGMAEMERTCTWVIDEDSQAKRQAGAFALREAGRTR